MQSIPIYFLKETLRFKLTDCSVKTMVGNGLTNIFWTPLTRFEYTVGEKEEAGRGRGKATYEILILLF